MSDSIEEALEQLREAVAARVRAEQLRDPLTGLGNRLMSRAAPTVNVSVGSCTNVETNMPLVDANAAVMLP